MAAAFAAARFDLLWVADASLLAHPLDLQFGLFSLASRGNV
jgi:hypothetical protein